MYVCMYICRCVCLQVCVYTQSSDGKCLHLIALKLVTSNDLKQNMCASGFKCTGIGLDVVYSSLGMEGESGLE